MSNSKRAKQRRLKRKHSGKHQRDVMASQNFGTIRAANIRQEQAAKDRDMSAFMRSAFGIGDKQ